MKNRTNCTRSKHETRFIGQNSKTPKHSEEKNNFIQILEEQPNLNNTNDILYRNQNEDFLQTECKNVKAELFEYLTKNILLK